MISDNNIKMGHDNQAFSNSSISLSMPQEPRGSYRGSNEFIRKSIRTAYLKSIMTPRCVCVCLRERFFCAFQKLFNLLR